MVSPKAAKACASRYRLVIGAASNSVVLNGRPAVRLSLPARRMPGASSRVGMTVFRPGSSGPSFVHVDAVPFRELSELLPENVGLRQIAEKAPTAAPHVGTDPPVGRWK